MTRRWTSAGRIGATLALALTLVACTAGPDGPAAVPAPPLAPPPAPIPAPTEPTGPPRPSGPTGPTAAERPSWLGTRPLPIAPDGFGARLPTPPELVDRRLPPPPAPPGLPEPPEDGTFAATVAAVPSEVVARSTWRPDCPVTLEDLRYVTATFVGFDGRTHTGELVVHADLAEDVVAVLRALHAAAFPLEEVRVIAAAELDLPPTGDGNVTTAFVCRPAVGSTRWSEHASGRALDINPFHNPYVRGDLVLPELAGAYTDRTVERPGMVLDGGPVEAAFAAVGWRWGGRWTTAQDWMHFSPSGR
jgi:hypothetical protein